MLKFLLLNIYILLTKLELRVLQINVNNKAKQGYGKYSIYVSISKSNLIFEASDVVRMVIKFKSQKLWQSKRKQLDLFCKMDMSVVKQKYVHMFVCLYRYFNV